MTVLEDMLEEFGEKSRNDILKIFQAQGLTDKVKSKNDFFSYWASLIGPYYYRDSILPVSRQIEILKELMEGALSKYIKNKAVLLEEISNYDRGCLEQPAWDSINFSDSLKGKRLQFGFKNKGCQYWHNAKNKLGCYNCGYFIGTQRHHFLEISEEDYNKSIIKQLEWIEKKYKDKENFDVVDIEGDGSFFNPWEFPKETQLECFKRLAKWKTLTHILVESRPEYINIEWITELLNVLRADQVLEIAIGIESMDRFIRTHCINKGFASIFDNTQKESVENILKEVAKFDGRIHIQAYLLIKPAFLNESEALADAINSGRLLRKWAKKFYPEDPHKILSLKYEPVVINRGTLLEVLHKSSSEQNHKQYTPLNLWTVAELLTQLAFDETYESVRFGAREDMDDYIAMPVVPGNYNTISPIDFRLYHAIQKFCASRSIMEFLTDVELLLSDDSFFNWKKITNIHKSALELFVETYREEISVNKGKIDKKLKLYYDEIQRLSFYLQNERKSRDFFKELSVEINHDYRKCKLKLSQFIKTVKKDELRLSNHWEFEIRDLRWVHDNEYKSVIFKMEIENSLDLDSDLWLSIPTDFKEPKNKTPVEEIERKYIVDKIPVEILQNISPTHIVQGYIAISDEEEVRVRKKFNPGKALIEDKANGKLNPEYILTRKSKGDLSREETEENITEGLFNTFLQSTSGRIIEKDRYKIPIGPKSKDWEIELDIFKGKLTGLVSAEVEFNSVEDEKDFQQFKPNWFGADVTFDQRFKNNSLALKGMTTILTPYNRRYYDKCLFLSHDEHSPIPHKIKTCIKSIGLKPQRLSKLVFETSGEIGNDVVEVLRSVPLIVADDNCLTLNLLTKLAVREAARRPLIRLSKTREENISAKWLEIQTTDNIPTALSTNLEGFSLSDIVSSQQIVDNEILGHIESEATEICVISTTLEFDIGELLDVVYKNLMGGKKYRYFVPKLSQHFRYSETLNRNIAEFWKHFGNFRENVNFFELDFGFPLNLKEIVIYYPRNKLSVSGFTYIVPSMGRKPELIRIPREYVERIPHILKSR